MKGLVFAMLKKELTNYERRIVELIGSTIIPNPRGSFTRSVKDVDIASKVSEHLSFLAFEARWIYRLFLILIAWGAPFYKLRFRRFSKMNFVQRTEYLGAWHRTWWSPKRLIARFVEALINMNYYAVPEVAEECGYRPVFSAPLPPPDFPAGSLIAVPLEGDHEVSVDVCVIGSGAGGAVAAKELSEQGRSVAILEEGSYRTAEEFGRDALTMTKLLYRDGGLLATFGWPNILVPLGRCVGGTTVINSGSSFRCPDHVLERWVYEFGLSKWSPSKLDSYFAKVEGVLGVQIPRRDLLSRNNDVFIRGLTALGLRGGLIPRNASGCRGSGVCAFGCPTRGKKSMELNYIPLALKSGAVLYANCRAERIVYEKTRASHVAASFINPSTGAKTGRLIVKAKVVVVSCGTIHTPVLLKNSKVPDTGGQIGRNLTLHPAAKVIALFDEEVKAWDGIPQSYYMDDLAAEGIRLEQIFTPPAFVAPNLMFSGEAHSDVMTSYNRLACFGMIIQDTSRGRVFVLPKGRAGIWYSVNKYDLPKYLRGIARISEIFFAAGAKKVFPCIYKVPVITREEGARRIFEKKIRPKDLDLQAFHPLGTCRMGVDPRNSAVDPNGRLYGMDNIYIADGSIFPTSLGVNPQITIMAAATKIAEHIHKEQL